MVWWLVIKKTKYGSTLIYAGSISKWDGSVQVYWRKNKKIMCINITAQVVQTERNSVLLMVCLTFVLLDLQIDAWIHLHLRGQCVLLSLLIKTLILKHKTPHRYTQSNVWPNVWEFGSSVKTSSEKYTFFFLLCGACLLILCNSQCSRHLCLLTRRMLQGCTCQKKS